MKSRFFDVRSPFFEPLWRRVLVVALSLGWAVVEVANGAPGWALVFAAAGLWCGWQFFVTWDRRDDEADDGES